MTEPCKDGDHAPELVQDCYGDPDVPNGTVDCSFFQCAICGEFLDDEELWWGLGDDE